MARAPPAVTCVLHDVLVAGTSTTKKENTNMYKNILFPTDGSPLSHRAGQQAVAIAKSIGARIIGFHVAPAYRFDVHEDYVSPNFVLPKDYAVKVKKIAEVHLDILRRTAEAAKVPCETYFVTSDFPADAIVKAAKKYKCNAIAMGSHGRSGISKLLLGSETQKVLAASKLPVIVLR